VEVVVVLPINFQCPETRRWTLTGTLAAQPVNPSPILTTPRATKCLRRLSVMLLAGARAAPDVRWRHLEGGT
jgi:hypothetical protein